MINVYCHGLVFTINTIYKLIKNHKEIRNYRQFYIRKSSSDLLSTTLIRFNHEISSIKKKKNEFIYV